ncbi:MAG: glycosyltransferase family 4 protein [Planctomycetes bacterium]|nr:glycosyltransferase family 4 protein [Planctomycetota bacterium]
MHVVFAHHEPIDPGRARWAAIVRSLAAVAGRAEVTWYSPDSAERVQAYAADQLALTLPAGLKLQTLPSVHKRMGLTLNSVFFRAFIKALGKSKAGLLWLRSDKLAAHASHKGVAMPLVYEAHLVGEMWARDRGDSDRKARRLSELERDIYAKAAGVAAITKGLLDEIRSRFGFNGPGVVVPSAVDTNVFKPCFEPDGQTVVWIGTLQFWKGLTTLLEAIAQSPGLRLRVIGGGKPEAETALRDEVARLGITDRVQLVGRVAQKDISLHVKGASCAVHPLPPEHSISSRFTSPLKLFEYMAMGLPIVAADVGSVREVLLDGANARLYEGGNAGSLAAALREVTGDSALAGRLSAESSKIAGEFTYGRRAERLLELFEKL